MITNRHIVRSSKIPDDTRSGCNTHVAYDWEEPSGKILYENMNKENQDWRWKNYVLTELNWICIWECCQCWSKDSVYSRNQGYCHQNQSSSSSKSPLQVIHVGIFLHYRSTEFFPIIYHVSQWYSRQKGNRRPNNAVRVSQVLWTDTWRVQGPRTRHDFFLRNLSGLVRQRSHWQ